MKKFLLFCAALAAASWAYAEVVYIRSGAVLCAETSTVKPSGLVRLGSAVPPEDPVYVAVTVKLDEGRRISIFDYALKVGGKSYECTAIRESSGRFVEFSDGGRKRRCTLIFELPSSPSGRKTTLVCNAPGGGETNVKLVDRGSRRFTPDAKIADPGK